MSIRADGTRQGRCGHAPDNDDNDDYDNNNGNNDGSNNGNSDNSNRNSTVMAIATATIRKMTSHRLQ